MMTADQSNVLHQSLPRRLSQRRRSRILLVGFLLAAALAIAVVWSSLASGSGQSDATQAGLDYARLHMVWSGGPNLRSAHVVPLGQLDAALARYTSPTVRRDVNVPQLIRQYGPNRQVDLVVLNGVFNTLAPDEGVIVHADVVALVDAHTNRVLLLTD